ncbi:MAG: hypothetical protein ACM3ZB_09695 [bacterium]
MRRRGPEPRPKVVVIQSPAPPVPQFVLTGTAHPEHLAVIKGYLEWLWSFRRCRVCGDLGPCEDREPDIDIGRAEGWFDYLKGLSR